MLQTNPSGPSLGALSLETPSKNGVEQSRGSADEFSQEYDKQVKNINSREQSAEVPEAPPAPDAKGEASDKAASGGEELAGAEETTTSTEQAAIDEEQGGNTLPLEQMRKVAAEVQLQATPGSQDEGAPVEPDLQQVAEAEVGAEGSEPTLATIAPQPQQDSIQDSIKSSPGHAVASTVKQAIAPKLEGQGKDVINVEEAAAEELAADEGELPELQLKPRGKSSEFAAMLARQPKQGEGGEAMLRGDRGFDALLAAQGRSSSVAASIDTLTPTLAPLAGQGSSSPLATPVPVAMTLATPMHQANWGQAMAERVVWMTNANIQEAEIQLNPRELGPIGIKVTVQNDQTNVSFVAQHATTREALEAALPRLREMLNENGLQLGQSDVSQHSFKGRDGEAGDGSGRGTGVADEALEAEEQMLAAEAVHGVGYASPSGVDAFA
jgi:flagellar hook-length control protein FliK